MSLENNSITDQIGILNTFKDIGKVSYEKEPANLKKISKKIKTKKQNEITPFSGLANDLGLPEEKELPEEKPEEKPEETKDFINPENEKDYPLMDNFHNFYINFFKYLKYLFGTYLTSGYNSRTSSPEFIKKFVFNYGSNVLASSNYYTEGNYELPLCNINLLDLRAENPVNHISKISKGIHDINQINIASNFTKDEYINVALQRYYMNISIEIILDDSSQVLDYISFINKTIPLNFTVYTPKYLNYINVSSCTKGWENSDDYIGLIKQVNNTYKNKEYNYASLNFNPTMEMNSISQSVSKEENLNTINMDFIFGLSIPAEVVHRTPFKIEKITLDINTATNDRIINELPLINYLEIDSSGNSLINSNGLSIGSRTATIKEKLILEALVFPGKENNIFSFGINKDLIKEVFKDDEYRFGIWMLKDNKIEKFIPLGYLNKYCTKKIYKENPELTKEENIDIFFNGTINTDSNWIGIKPKDYLDEKNILIEFEYEPIVEDNRIFHYLLKSEYLLAEANKTVMLFYK